MLKLFKPSVILEDLGPLLQYLPVTLGIALVSIFFAFLLGFFVAMIKINKVPVLSNRSILCIIYKRNADSGTVVSVLLRNPDPAAVPELLFRHEPEYQQRAQCGVRAGGICIK